MVFQNKNSQLTSIFNETSLKIRRLNDIWMACRYARKHGQQQSYADELVSAEMELGYDAKRLDGEFRFKKRLRLINLHILNINKCISKLKEEDEKIKSAKLNEKWQTLIRKESLLREVQQESGLGTGYKDKSEDEMDD